MRSTTLLGFGIIVTGALISVLVVLAFRDDVKPTPVTIRIAWCATDPERERFSGCVSRSLSAQEEIDPYAVYRIEDSCRRSTCPERDVTCAARDEVYARNNASALCRG